MMDDYKNFVERMGSFEDEINITDNLDNEIVTRNRSSLTHYGVLGMKWGVRKSINPKTVGAASKTGKNVTDLGQTINRGRFNKKTLNKAKKLSDEDLKRITSRLELENRYINARTQQQGRDRVENILSTSAAALSVVSSAAVMVEAIKKAKAQG